VLLYAEEVLLYADEKKKCCSTQEREMMCALRADALRASFEVLLYAEIWFFELRSTRGRSTRNLCGRSTRMKVAQRALNRFHRTARVAGPAVGYSCEGSKESPLKAEA